MDAYNGLGIAIAATYVACLASGVTIYALRNSVRGAKKRLWLHIFLISTSIFFALLVVLVTSSEKTLNWVTVWITVAVLASLWTAAFVLEARHPVDYTRPLRLGAESSEDRDLQVAAWKLTKGENLTPAERTALEQAMAKSCERSANAPDVGE